MTKKLFSNSMIYLVSLLFNKGLNFVLLPILTFYLTKEDYGVLGLITAISTITSIYIGFFPSSFLLVKFSLYGKEKISEYIHHIFILTLISFFFVLFVLLGFKDLLLPEHLEQKSFIVVIITCYSLFTVFLNFLDTIFQIEKNAIKFAILQTFQSISALGLSLLLIIEFSFNWKGKYYAELVILFSIFVFTIYYIIKNDYYKFNTDYSKFKEIFAFLFPITFSVLGLYIIGTIDRIYVSNILGLEAAGIYNVAIIMAFIINMVFDSIMKVLNPTLYEKFASNSEESKIQIVKIIYAHSIICILIYLSYLFFLPFLFNLMINVKFADALQLIPILALGFTIEGLRKAIEVQLIFKNKVNLLAIITIIGSLTSVILNYFLIDIYGLKGAAYSTVGAFFVLYVLTLIFFIRNNNLLWLMKKS